MKGEFRSRPSSKNSPEPANHANSVIAGFEDAGTYFARSVDIRTPTAPFDERTPPK